MQGLIGKQIIVGISGGIAAYKAAELVRELRKAGSEVRVVMTNAAQEFITPLTLQALSGNPVHTDLLDLNAEAAMGHIELARWADLILIAPATAETIAKLSQGRAEDLLTAVCLARRCQLAIAPAMNQAMWADEPTQQNVKVLHERKIQIFGPASGEQACGDVGEGRMLEPSELCELSAKLFSHHALGGKRVLITAGPTREAIDPVRFLSNRSSGKMGYAIAQAAQEAGAAVTLISGPVALNTPDRVQRINVISASQMQQEVMANISKQDIFISAAAVADYTPDTVAENKIKKQEGDLTLTLKRTTDILAQVAALDERPFCVGFAAETESVIAHARAKLERKNLDMIVANDVSQKDIGFGCDENAVTIITPEKQTSLARVNKLQLARELIEHIRESINVEDPA